MSKFTEARDAVEGAVESFKTNHPTAFQNTVAFIAGVLVGALLRFL